MVVDHQPPRFVLTFHPRFKRFALEEAAAVAPDLAVVEVLDVDSVLVDVPSAGASFADRLVAARPVFVLHVAPVEHSVAVTGERDDLATLAAAVDYPARLDPSRSFAVQSRRGQQTASGVHGEAAYTSRDVEIAIGQPIENAGFSVDLRRPDQVVSVYLAGEWAHVGVSRTEANLAVFADPHRVYSASPPTVSRAEFKLVEALDVFGVSPLPGWRALDVGAAPGGWSIVLARLGVQVTAVDPAALAPVVAEHPNVQHHRMRLEYAPLDGDYDLVVNDMNLDPPESAALMCMAASSLRAGASAIMTIKLPKPRPGRDLDAAVEVLACAYDVLRVRQMFFNRQEVTLHARYRGSVTPGWESALVARGRPPAT